MRGGGISKIIFRTPSSSLAVNGHGVTQYDGSRRSALVWMIKLTNSCFIKNKDTK